MDTEALTGTATPDPGLVGAELNPDDIAANYLKGGEFTAGLSSLGSPSPQRCSNSEIILR